MNFRFDAFALDTDGYILTKGTEAIALEPQVFALLQFLIENRDRVVSKDEIIEQVWDGRIVSDAALTSSINGPRRAVGDSGKAQAIIKTFPRRGFRFVAEVTEDYRSAATTPPVSELASDKSAIAVLPFDNLSGDPEQEYFSDGITEDIITDLSKVSGLFVLARAATLRCKGRGVDPWQLAKDLDVDYVVSGSVRRSADRLRISAQLIDAGTGQQIWAERYDRTQDDIFAIQENVARNVVEHAAGILSGEESSRVGLRGTESLEAYDFYLKAGRISCLRRRRISTMDATISSVRLRPIPNSTAAMAGWLKSIASLSIRD